MLKKKLMTNTLVVCLLMTTALAGCLGDDETDDEDVIRLAFTVKDDYENPDTNPQMMADYIEQHSGYEVEIYPISSSNAAIEAVRFGHADAAFLDGGAAFVAWKSHGLEAILADTKSDGSTYYTAAAWVKNSSNITTLEQLEGNNSCHTGWLKSAGMLMPMGYMISQGIVDVEGDSDDIESLRTTIENHFDVATIPESGAQYYGYSGAFECMTAGVGDVAFAKTSSYEDHCEGNDWCLASDEYRILEPHFGQVPTHPVMINPDEIGDEKRDALVAAMLAMSGEMWVEDYPMMGTNYTGCYSLSTHNVTDIPQNTCGGEILKNVLENKGAVVAVTSESHLGSYSDAIGVIPGINAYFEEKYGE
ncbi:MAG: PhnD/SsuA/transferrin family substrate-binding protein [Candidatus Thermoplasmatota archaeon]|nr:PhnD/SsuA/transferrin family substrate-binding protein [Candidatus Thermoplasmatota archaeon]MEE3083813.1 PhnD/SsuA/transferrin family substrate-binding protein [Candidatus Thermoplasmatota archaeon]